MHNTDIMEFNLLSSNEKQVRFIDSLRDMETGLTYSIREHVVTFFPDGKVSWSWCVEDGHWDPSIVDAKDFASEFDLMLVKMPSSPVLRCSYKEVVRELYKLLKLHSPRGAFNARRGVWRDDLHLKPLK